MTTAQTTQTVRLHLAGSAGDGTPLPLGLAGLPTEIEGKPVYYRRKEICHVVNEPHRGRRDPVTGQPVIVDIPASRLDLWAQTFKKRAAKGIKPFLYPRHLDLENGEQADARHTQGYLIDVERDGEKLYGTLQLIGEDARKCAAANDVSVTVTADALDSEFLHHLAFTPNQQITGMEGYTALVASADGKSVRVPVFVLSDTTTAGAEPATERSIVMKPETITKLRAKLNLTDAKAVPDEEIAERAATLALADPPKDNSAEVARLSADVTKLTKERDDAKAEAQKATLQLSANAPKEPDALTLSLTLDAFNTKREQAIASGTISEAGMKAIDALLMPGGKPNGVALALSGDGTSARPLYARLCEIIAANPGIKTGNAVNRGTKAEPQPLSLSGDSKEPDYAKIAAETMAKEMARQYGPTAKKLGAAETVAATA